MFAIVFKCGSAVWLESIRFLKRAGKANEALIFDANFDDRALDAVAVC